MQLKKNLGMAVALLTLVAGTGSASAQATTPLHVVSYYEIIPAPQGSEAQLKPAEILLSYQQSLSKESGAVTIELLRDRGRHGHFTLIEEWNSQQAYAAHNASARAQQFAADIAPFLASPKDERAYTRFR